MTAWLKDNLIRLRADAARAHKSMTIWFNGIAGTVVLALPFAQDQLPQLQGYLPPGVYHYLMGVVVAGNIILRFKTRSALAAK